MNTRSLLKLAVLAGLTAVSLFAQQSNPSVVIAQVYGAGGNANATLRNDYVVLFNRTNASVTLTGWSLQYASATGTGNFGASASQLVTLTGSIAPYSYYLVLMNSGGTAGTVIPVAADATNTSLAVAAGAGKFALVDQTTTLGCNGATNCTSAQLSHIIDLVGWGNATFFESAVAPTTSTTLAIFRAGGGCFDTNNNAADFAAVTVTATGAGTSPLNSASAVNSCGGPSISLSTTSGRGGTSDIPVIITGTNTNFNEDQTTVTVSGTGVTVGARVISSPTSLSTTFSVAANASAGARTVTVSTGSETATAVFTVLNNSPAITTSALPAATAGQPYSTTLGATGGSGTYTSWSITNFGNLSPTNQLSISNTGVLSGTISAAQTFVTGLQIQVTDSNGLTGTATFSLAINAVGGSCVTTHTIEDIQGSGDLSPLVSAAGGTSANTVTFSGVVTAIAYNGLFVQQTSNFVGGSDDPNKSNGIFVFTTTTPNTALRTHNVCVTGKVQEYAGGDTSGVAVTEIASSVNVVDLGTTEALPAPIVLTTTLPDPNGTYNQLEKYEGMRVQASPSLTVVAANEDSFGNLYAVVTGNPRPFREPGIEAPDSTLGTSALVWNGNPERLKLDLTGQAGATPTELTVGQTISDVVGPLHYGDRTYTIYPDAGFTTGGTPLTLQPVPAPQTNDLTIANFNTEHFYDQTGGQSLSATAYATKLTKLSKIIREVLRSPDIVVMEEVENIDVLQGVSGSLTGLVQQIASDGGPTYTPYLQEGNDVGGIDIAFLVNAAKVNVVSVTQENKNETWVDPTGSSTALLNDRPPLVLKATAARSGGGPAFPFTVIGVHQKSLIGVAGNTASAQRNREKRAKQAESLANLIRTKYLNDNLIVSGDFNAYEFSDGYVDVIGGTRGAPAPANQTVRPISDLYDPDLVDIGQTYLPPSERYSYSFQGNAQMIDQILANQQMLPYVRQFAIGHPNSVFPESLRSNAARAERVSDHDTPIVYLNLPAAPTVANLTLNSSPAGLTVLVDGTPYVAPRVLQFPVNSTHTIAVTSPQTLSGNTWTFQSWSDSGAQSHAITLSADATYTATFTTAAPPTGTFGVSAAVTSRTNGSGTDQRVYVLRFTNNGTLAATNCAVSAVTFPAPANNTISLQSTLPLTFGALAASGGTASFPLIATVPTTTSTFQMRLTGSCTAGATTQNFTTTVTTFR